ncbi:MAG: outer membrane beta-barrel protein [Gemmatimonadota bacterium]
MMIRRAVATLSLAMLCGAASSASAQSAQRWSIQVSGISVGAYGDAYEGLSNGLGLEGQVRLTPSVWSFGAGFQVSSHTFGLDDGSEESAVIAGIFFEPRLVFDVGSTSYAPYISGRISVLSQSADFDIPGETVSASSTGTQFNGGGGVLFRLSPRVNLDVGATFGVINFGDFEVSAQGTTFTVEGSSGTGQNLVIRVGLAIGLGS